MQRHPKRRLREPPGRRVEIGYGNVDQPQAIAGIAALQSQHLGTTQRAGAVVQDDRDITRRSPSVSRLAESHQQIQQVTDVSSQYIRQCMKKFIADGRLEIVRKGSGRGNATIYRVLPRVDAVGPQHARCNG